MEWRPAFPEPPVKTMRLLVDVDMGFLFCFLFFSFSFASILFGYMFLVGMWKKGLLGDEIVVIDCSIL